MSGDRFYIAQGDTLPAISATLLQEDGEPANLTGAAVVFRMKNIEQSVRISARVIGTATIVEAGAGKVRYDWKPGETAIAGLYLAEWVVTIGGAVSTYPNSRYLLVQIRENLS